MTEQTIEDMQNEILELKEQLETMNATVQSLTDDKNKVTEERDNARALNAKLMRRAVSKETEIMDNNGEEPETIEQFIDSFLMPAKKAMLKSLGIDEE